jgi:hypothetical protein
MLNNEDPLSGRSVMTAVSELEDKFGTLQI